MGLFHRETLSAIKWRFQDGELAARYPQENLNSSSVIFVQPGQEALFIKEGQICDVLREGRYQLTSENLPLLLCSDLSQEYFLENSKSAFVSLS